ncbi:MAG: hypothetical protein MK089_02695 [Phycisphaerales bacterium]|nr:hypothetical protein [Phycisphaerales bacterium]
MKFMMMMAGGLAFATASTAMGDVLAFESFENYELGGKYYDTLGSDNNHQLINNDGEAIVDGDIWNSYYYDTGDVGLTDGDWVGVTDFAGSTGGFTDGDQAFQWTDTDGNIEMVFDGVAGATVITMDVFILGGGYESSDFLSIGMDGWSGGFYATGDDLEGYGYWMQVTLTLEDAFADGASLNLSMAFNAASEGMFIDNIVWYDAIPAPGALALLGLAGLAGGRRRRN